MSELIAVLDLGSTAARFVLARVIPGEGFRVLHEERVQTRLGDARRGRLTREAIEGTLDAVGRFLVRLGSGPRPRVVAVATSAVREAANRERLLGPLRRDHGVVVRVLSGREEARLGGLAALHGLSLTAAVAADLGGGSLQLTRLRRRRVVSTASVPLGAVRLTRRFLRHDPPSPRELRALRLEVRRGLLRALPVGRREETLVGLGGTARMLARMQLAARGDARTPDHGLPLRPSQLTALREALEARSVRERRELPGLEAERADVVLAGAIVLEEVMLLGGWPALLVCAQGVRHGLLVGEAFP